MLSNKHLYEELQLLEATCSNCKDVTTKALLKSNILMIKLLHNVRTNQVVAMTANDISLISARKSHEEEETE